MLGSAELNGGESPALASSEAEPPSAVLVLADDYVERVEDIGPLTATHAGIGSHDHALPGLDVLRDRVVAAAQT